MTAVQLVNELVELGDPDEEFRIENAADRGWLVEDGAALVELDGHRYIVRIVEV